MDTTAARPAIEATAILDFWFGPPDADEARIASRQSTLWWGKDPAVDRQVRNDFDHLREAAAGGALAAWLGTPRGRLALIVLVDQFTRMRFRDDPRAWADDATALDWCIEGIRRGDDRRLRPIERVFLYMPLQHAEDMFCQHASVACFEALETEVPAAWREAFANFSSFARAHRDVIADFGRFPHRNTVLGRSPTAAETVYLAQPGAGF